MEGAIQMALQPTEVYDRMQNVFELFENHQLKGQRKPRRDDVTFQKMMEGQYSAKLYQFKPFQGLKVLIMGIQLTPPIT